MAGFELIEDSYKTNKIRFVFGRCLFENIFDFLFFFVN